MVMVLAVMVVGIWAATLQVGGISISVTYIPDDVSVDYRVAVFNDANFEGSFLTAPLYTTSNSIDAEDGGEGTVLSRDEVAFTKYFDVYMIFIVKNTSSSTMFLTLASYNDYPHPSNVGVSHLFGVSDSVVDMPLSVVNLRSTYGLGANFSSEWYDDMSGLGYFDEDREAVSNTLLEVESGHAACFIIKHEISDWTRSLTKDVNGDAIQYATKYLVYMTAG